MAMSMEADSEVLFKEKREGKGVKAETAVDNATLRFDFRASTPATLPPGRGAEHRGGDGEEQRRIELKKFSLRKRTVAAVTIDVGPQDRGVGHGGKWTIPPWTDRGERGQLPGRYGIRGVHSGCTDVEEMGSCGGRANQVLGVAVLSGRTSARVPGQSATYRDSRNSGHKVELHSDGKQRR